MDLYREEASVYLTCTVMLGVPAPLLSLSVHFVSVTNLVEPFKPVKKNHRKTREKFLYLFIIANEVFFFLKSVFLSLMNKSDLCTTVFFLRIQPHVSVLLLCIINVH